MVDFILWVSVIGTGLCALVFLTLFTLMFLSLVQYVKDKTNAHALPPPDKAAERPWSQKYFERAIGRKNT